MTIRTIEPTVGFHEGDWRQRWLWVDGELRLWSDVTMPLTQATWSGLSAVFEGIKGYRSPDGVLHIFGLTQHLERFQNSIAFMRLHSRWSTEELAAACLTSLTANEIDDDCYLQPVAAPAPPASGMYAPPVVGDEVRVYICAEPRPSLLMTERALRCNVTSWTRISERSLPPRIKAVPNYQNSRIAHLDSKLSGFDAPIFLNERGSVAEGASACIAIVRGGTVITPPVTAGILESITRSFLLELIPEALGLPVIEREIDRTELYMAQEAFLLGTGAEISPVTEIDHYRVGTGEIGPITRRIQRSYHDAIRAIDRRWLSWLTPVQ
ncbi:MAG TPA: aminotransferase class IV [Dehalococcoidia bacterium]|nr:aminotransferase class IV [Dehalococcoidia bacterium]